MLRNVLHVTVHHRSGRAGFGVVGIPTVRHHFARVWLNDRVGQRVRWGLHPRSAVPFVRDAAARYGLCVVHECDVPPTLAPDVLRVPRAVSMTLPLADFTPAHERRLPTSARHDVARIRARGFSAVVCRDPAWAHEFFHRFHAPSIAARYGREGYVRGLRAIRRDVAQDGGEFLQIMRDGECVAALLGFPRSDGYRMAKLGWRAGDPQVAKSGALAAIYWFTMQRAHEIGLSQVRMGGTSPYLEDGQFRYKAKWGAVLERPGPGRSECFLVLNPAHPDCRRMLAARSLIACGPRQTFVVFSGRSPAETNLTPAIAASIGRWYRLRAAPDPTGGVSDPWVPATLRPWFTSEPVDTRGEWRVGETR